MTLIIGTIIGAAITFTWCGLLVKGADSMISLRGYGMAIATCIIAMLPCNLACLGGLPFGIWGLVVLCNSDVKRAFR